MLKLMVSFCIHLRFGKSPNFVRKREQPFMPRDHLQIYTTKFQLFNGLTWEGLYGEEARCYYNVAKCQIEAFQVMPFVILHIYLHHHTPCLFAAKERYTFQIVSMSSAFFRYLFQHLKRKCCCKYSHNQRSSLKKIQVEIHRDAIHPRYNKNDGHLVSK